MADRALTARFPRPIPRPSGRSWASALGLAAVLLIYLALLVEIPEPLLAVLLATALVLLGARRPDRALLVLIVLLPFQTMILSQLFAWGMPESIVRPLAGWKEALGLGVAVAGGIGFMRSGRRLDTLDLLALGLIAIIAAYALFPTLFASGAPTAADVRSLGFRQSAGFLILLLAARHAVLPPGFLRRALRVALGTAVVVAAIGIYEFIDDSSWNDFVVNTVELTNYKLQVLEAPVKNLFDYRSYGHVGGEEFLRVGSIFLSPLTCGFYLLIGFAIAIERCVKDGARWQLLGGLLLIGAAMIMTQTRSAIVGALIVGILALRPAAGRRTRLRVQVGLLFAVGLLLALPAATSTGLSERTSAAASGDDPSADKHFDASWRGLQATAERPLGRGLGTSAGVGQRFQSGSGTVTESAYLQVASETGAVPFVGFVALTILLLRYLRRAAARAPELAVTAIWTGAAGLAVASLFLHTWNDFAVSWTLWGLAGAALGAARATVAHEAESAPPEGGRAHAGLLTSAPLIGGGERVLAGRIKR